MKTLSLELKQKRNLLEFVKMRREVGTARSGYNKLFRDISNRNDKRLAKMLRNHAELAVESSAEISYRDDVDSLLQFYCLVLIGAMSGYFTSKLPSDMRAEILSILGNEYVQKYYTQHYKMLLCSVLYKYVSTGKSIIQLNEPGIFQELLYMEHFIDPDVDTYLWLLDDGYYDEYSIADLSAVLKSQRKVQRLVFDSSKSRETDAMAFWGFVKFSNYLVKYAELMKKCRSDYMRSSLWHYQTYWFSGLRDCIEGINVPMIIKLCNINSVENDGNQKDNSSRKRSANDTKRNKAISSALVNNEVDLNAEQQVVYISHNIKYAMHFKHRSPLQQLFRDIEVESDKQRYNIVGVQGVGFVRTTKPKVVLNR